MTTYVINTDAAHGAWNADGEWLRRGIAVMSGAEKYLQQLQRIQAGDTVVVYVKNVGITAAGVAADNEVLIVRAPDVVNPAEPFEYHRRVRWLQDLRADRIPVAEVKALLGQTPLQASQRVRVGESALLARLAQLSARPTADPAKYEQAAAAVLAHGPVLRSRGSAAPERIEASATQYYRDPLVRAWTLQRAAGHCELCARPAPFAKDDGSPCLESHHIVPLAEQGPDTPENTAALCPNCHRELHHGQNRLVKREQLRTQVLAKEAALG